MNTAGSHASLQPEERSLGALVSDLSRETTDLVHKEITLAKAEISEKISQLGSGAVALAVGGVVLFAGLLKLLDAATVALAGVLAPERDWLAPLIVGVIVIVVGWILLQRGRNKLSNLDLTPSRTVESLQRDKQFVKEQVQ